MIVARQKPIQEIFGMLPTGSKLLVVGCNTCTTICLAGGTKEVNSLCSLIRMSGLGINEVKGLTIERQCDLEFIEELAAEGDNFHCILSLACGVGVQMLSDYFPAKPVLPGLDTLFMGSNEEAGYWLERCLGCGECILNLTGGICPKTRCSKGLLNGPCGGSQDGKCEVDPANLVCGWDLIYRRLKALNRLDVMMEIQPPRDFSKMHDGKPRSLSREDVRL